MFGVQLQDGKKTTNLMLMMGLNETIDQFALANSVCWHGHVTRREDGHVMRRVMVMKGIEKTMKLKVK